MKLHANTPTNILVQMDRVVAKLAGKQVELKLIDQETKDSKDYKAVNPQGKFPLLETPEGIVSESMTIAKFLAHGHPTLLGSSTVERAQVDQWTTWIIAGNYQKGYPAIRSILGVAPIEKDAFKKSVDAIKANVRAINDSLKGDWLVGSSVTVADVTIAAILSMAFQLVLDAGFKKAAPKACEWFARVSALPEFISVFGRVKQAAKGVPQQVKAKEEPKKQQAAAPKKEEEKKEKKEGNPLDLLPPSPWNFYDFKTLFVNHPDKRGGAMEELKKQFDAEGYSIWYTHYEKYGAEGQVFYKFENLMKGFLQRFDHFRKHALAKLNMTGAEPDLDIKGVWIFRGLELPQEAKDHPQFEYMQPRKMDINNADDFALMAQHLGAKEGDGETCEGKPIVLSSWHK